MQGEGGRERHVIRGREGGSRGGVQNHRDWVSPEKDQSFFPTNTSSPLPNPNEAMVELTLSQTRGSSGSPASPPRLV